MSKKTKKDMNLWRAKTSCKLGREVLAGKSDPPEGVTESEMAMFYLLNAIEDIALYLEEK